jgi:glutamyl-Q tRNA(Asp) synthetase
LHLGSLFTAAASFLEARARGGQWLLRIEDLDRPREVPGAADALQTTLEAFGLHWDGPVVRQSGRLPLYAAALARLSARGLLFDCTCARRDLEEQERYPGYCRAGPRNPALSPARRLRVEPRRIEFHDRIQGRFRQDVAAAVGDLLLARRDGIYAYVLAVVVDDAAQGITEVVRGADLLDNTPRQMYLQQALGLATPTYAHVPLLTEPDGAKLAKSKRSVRLNPARPQGQLCAVLEMLGMQPPTDLATGKISEIWAWAIANWRLEDVPKCLAARVPVTAQVPDQPFAT